MADAKPVAQITALAGAMEDHDLDAARRDLAHARSRPYYDGEKDALDRKSYYRDLPGGEDGRALYLFFSDLLQRTHEPQVPYKPAREVYPWVDLQPNLKLRSVYSGQEFDPESLIEDDVNVAMERARLVQERVPSPAAASREMVAEELNRLEDELPFNCEHVVPQSWFDKDEPMRGDLHHLFACESRCNSFRGNTPYLDFPDFQEIVRDQCGKREEDGFEPSANKGIVARATLYFLLRYPGEISRSQEFPADRLPMLLKWHEDTPVEDYERHRNAAIFERQGNRNPLIDFPDLGQAIDFSLGLGGSQEAK